MTDKPLRKGDKIVVCDENGHPFFRATIADTQAPWWGWCRVVPEGYIDLPPRYKIRKAEEGGL